MNEAMIEKKKLLEYVYDAAASHNFNPKAETSREIVIDIALSSLARKDLERDENENC